MAVNMQELQKEHAQRGTEIAELKYAMQKLVAFIDKVLPQAGKLCFDVGNLNEALILARPLIGKQPIKKKHTPREMVEQCKMRWEVSLETLTENDFEAEELRQWIAAANCILDEFNLEGI